MTKKSTFAQSNTNMVIEASMSEKPLLILVDGHSLAFRAYYAFAKSRKGALQTSTGIPTSVCFGFLNSLLSVVEAQTPQYLAVAFDRGEPTFRHGVDANYKANRQAAPAEFKQDLDNLKELLGLLNLQQLSKPGYEADDVIATAARGAIALGYRVKILTGDRDLFQLVDDKLSVQVLYLDNSAFKSSSGGYWEYDEAAVTEKMKVTPQQIVDYKALCGDASDNIRGVAGIGDKTAVKLLQEYGSLESIYQHLDQIKGAVKTKLAAGKTAAETSQHLAQITDQVPLDISIDLFKLEGFNPQQVIPFLEKLELKSWIKKLDRLQQQLGGSLESELDNQQTQLPSLIVNSNPTKSVYQPPVESEDFQPIVVDTEAKLQTLVEQLQQQTDFNRPVAWDTETTDLNPLDAELVGIGCCWGNKPSDVAYIAIAHNQPTSQLDRQQIIESIAPILTNSKYPKAFHNAKFDILVLQKAGIRLQGLAFDTMLASYLLRPEASHKLSDVSERYDLEVTAQNFTDLAIPKGKTIADLDVNTVASYCGRDVYATYGLVAKLQADLAAVPQLHQLLLEVEQPLTVVLAEMEYTGISLDVDYLQQLSQQLDVQLQSLENQIYEYAGEEFNLGSPKQLSEILFDRLGLDRRKSRKTKTGYSTNQAVLEKLSLDHPIIDDILSYRTLAKLKSTYVDALPKLVRQATGRVHTNFNQTVVTTGRLSSSNPNLQNIPIRTEFSRQIRRAFIPQSDWLLVAADYSQIELRILAHLSQEPVLVEAYQRGEDVHSVTAKLMFDKDTVTSDQRRLGKIINFGVIYGMGAQRFARESGIDSQTGKQFIQKYRQRYAKVFDYLESVKREAVINGYVTTILGRRRYFEFGSKNLQKLRGSEPDFDLDEINYGWNDAQLLRAAANATIQGSSADIIKMAMVKLQPILQEYEANLLLQVHDELVLEVDPSQWPKLQPILIQTMQDAIELSVPLVVEAHAGPNWMEAK